jgi:hypothetical protein
MNTRSVQPNPVAWPQATAGPSGSEEQSQPWPDEAEWLCEGSGSFEDELLAPADDQERAGRVLRQALGACPDLTHASAARDALWITMQDEICTSAPKLVRPFGSSKSYLVTQEHATDELITAMRWLTHNETEARNLTPLELFVRLRGVATKSGGGSARSAQADSLCGITGVPPGQTLAREPLREVDAA